MSALFRWFFRLSILACACASAAGAHAGSTLATDGNHADARLDIRVVIPAILRVLEDDHPALLPVAGGTSDTLPLEQHIVMLSTLRKGFCLDLRLGTAQILNWKLQLKDSPYARIEATAGGYRLCVSRAGRHVLALSHDFRLGAQPAGATPLDWPVYLSLSAP